MLFGINPDDIANVILHVILIATFIGIFFFTYASRVEKEIVENQVDYLVKDFTQNLSQLSSEHKEQLKTAISTIQAPDMTKVDTVVNNMNAELMKKAGYVIGIMLVIGSAIIYYLYTKYNINLKSLMIHNAIILIAVAVTEFFFLNYVAKNFISADANRTKKTLISTIRNIQ